MNQKITLNRVMAVSVCLLVLSVCLSVPTQEWANPPEGFVPNKETAIRIAVAVWIPLYGEENIEKQAPYEVRLVNDAWAVNGTLQKNSDGSPAVGGVAMALIAKKDGRILRVLHEK